MSRKSPNTFVRPKQSLLDWIRAVELHKADAACLWAANEPAPVPSASPLSPKVPVQIEKPKNRRAKFLKSSPIAAQ